MTQHSIFKDAVAFLLFSLLLIAGCWTLLHEVQTQFSEIISAKPLIVLSSFHGYLPGAVFGVVFMLGYAGSRLLRGLRLQPQPANNGKVTAIGILISLVLIVLGNFAINAYWQNRAENGGYQQCPPFSLLTNRVTMTAWSNDEILCLDKDVREIIVRGTPDETAQLAQHLNARAKQQQAKQQFLLQEAQSKRDSFKG
jgi:hypothetical protein